ncbi:MAG: enoyl-CoA hydratase-related protein [Pseudomonadales bacterium]
MSTYTDIEYDVVDPVATIRLNRPERLNAFTYHTLAEIRAAVEAVVTDTRVVGIVITGQGRGFCAGLDADVLASVTSNAQSDSDAAKATPEDQLPGIFSYLLEVPKPVIAAINGVAAGGGLILALMSDLRFAADDAAFTTVFLRRGLISEHGSSWLLPRLVGVSRALSLLWTSEKITAQAALDVGLIDEVVAPEELQQKAREYIEALAQSAPPLAIAETKRLVYRHLGCGYLDALREAEISQNQFVAGADAAEGAKAYLEKRAPKFQRLGRRI